MDELDVIGNEQYSTMPESLAIVDNVQTDAMQQSFVIASPLHFSEMSDPLNIPRSRAF